MSEKTKTSQLSLSAQIEALLFIAPTPITLSQLSAVMDVTTNQIDKSLLELETTLQERGIRIQRHQGRIQFTTAPEAAPLIESFLGLEATTRLSAAALEALAIVAYQQPVTRPQIDAVRGVNSDGVLKSLLHKGIIEEIGRAESPGRPILYGTTTDFLQHFGLKSLDELPPLELEEDSKEVL